MSTSYLDEAERCGHVVVLHQGKVLAQGRPGGNQRSGKLQSLPGPAARGPKGARPAGASARGSRSRRRRAGRRPGAHRLVTWRAGRQPSPERQFLAGATIVQTEARFEDGFMILLHREAQGSQEKADQHTALVATEREPFAYSKPATPEIVVEVHDLVRRFGILHGRRSRQLRGPQRARSSACSARTAPARRRRSACCADCCQPRAATCAWRAWICVTPGTRPASGSVTWPKSSRSTASYRCSKTWNSSPAPTACAAGSKRDRIDWRHAAVRPGGAGAPAQRPVARRLQAAPGDGGGAAARAGDPVPGRADQRRRPAGSPRVLAADHGPGRAGRDRDRHDALHGRGRVLRPRRHPGPGQSAGRRAPPPRFAVTPRPNQAASPRWKTPSSPSSKKCARRLRMTR